MAEMTLTLGYATLVDDDDATWLSQWEWRAQVDRRSGDVRVVRWEWVDGKTLAIYMHREIMGLPRGIGRAVVVDHRNHDTLDNRRENLRVATHAQNMANRRSKRGGTSRFLGVSLHRPNRKWRAGITVGGVNRAIGYFADELDAARAYNVAALEAHGEFAHLNDVKIIAASAADE